MTDTTLPPDDSARTGSTRLTSSRRCSAAAIDHAMSVIVGRALPEVRDLAQARIAGRSMQCSIPARRPQPRQVGPVGCRDHGQLPPARRRVDSRHPGAHGPALVAALPAADGQATGLAGTHRRR